ncbi:MAG: YncE family protein [Bacteroidia bacterium]|nr:YncE family protein [Bacteroidia bacterium]
MKPSIPVLLGAALLAAALSACKPDGAEAELRFTRGVFVLNEGNFLASNATLDFWDETEDSAALDVFERVNGRPLGDVLQSMTLDGSRAYLVVNNSGKIEAVQTKTLESVGTITGLTSPRYLLPLGNTGRAYVSDLAANAISIVDLDALSVTGSIPLPGWSEEMIQIGSDVFVSHQGRPYVYVIDTRTDQVTDSIAAGAGGNSLGLDENGKLWVLCGGDFFTSTPASLHRIDPASRTAERSWTFPAGQFPANLRLNPAGDTVYYLNTDVFAMPVGAAELPAAAFIAAGGASFYALGVHPRERTLYIADAIDYAQRGTVLRYSARGALLDSFKAGIIPGEFVFLE